jgi:twitching motility protein PilT
MGQQELDIKDTGCFAGLFAKAKEYDATDIYILEGRVPRLGRLKLYSPVKESGESARKDIERLIDITTPVPDDGNGGPSVPANGKRLNMEYAFAVQGHGRYRVSATRSEEGIGLAIRKLPYHIPPLREIDKLNFLKGLLNVFEGRDTQGLILHTGVTGSGKSTTIASEVDTIARTVSGNILTFEAPIEYHYTPTRALIRQYEVGVHVDSYIEGMKMGLRNDVSVIVIGEVRTHEEIRTMVDIAMRGHIVFATLHTSNALNTVRFLDSTAENKESSRQLLAHSLKAVISQKLMWLKEQGFIFIPEILIPNNVVRQKIESGDFKGIKELFLTSHELTENGSSTFENTLNVLVKNKIIANYDKPALVADLTMV